MWVISEVESHMNKVSLTHWRLAFVSRTNLPLSRGIDSTHCSMSTETGQNRHIGSQRTMQMQQRKRKEGDPLPPTFPGIETEKMANGIRVSNLYFKCYYTLLLPLIIQSFGHCYPVAPDARERARARMALWSSLQHVEVQLVTDHCPNTWLRGETEREKDMKREKEK